MFVNEDSENVDVFTGMEKKELIYQLFQIFCVGGGMCQPDTEIDRYVSGVL